MSKMDDTARLKVCRPGGLPHRCYFNIFTVIQVSLYRGCLPTSHKDAQTLRDRTYRVLDSEGPMLLLLLLVLFG